MRSFVIRFPWSKDQPSKPKLSPKEIRKQERRRQRHNTKRILRDEEKR